MVPKIIKLPILKRLIPSLTIRLSKFFNLNRGFFKIKNISMYMDLLDPIDREIFLNQSFENKEVNYLLKKIKKHKINTFIDVGANCGYYSVFVSKNFPKLNILSFEPNKEAYLKFKKTLKKNKNLLNKITLKNYGLSNRSQKMKMQSLVKHGYTQTGGSSVVFKSKFKNWVVYSANFKVADKVIKLNKKNLAIKIDVEGHELKVLDGMKKIFHQNKVIIQIEIFKNKFKETNSLIKAYGFKMIFKVKERQNYFYSNFK